MRIDIRGSLIPNNYKVWYDWMEQDSTCPRDVRSLLDQAEEGEEIEVYINSPGGVIDVGSEIYAALHQIRDKVKIYVTGQACSAASVVAMAAHCEMASTALMMVHCVSTSVSGNHADMEHAAEMLSTADKAMCQAYVEKTGMTEEEALAMMEHETWLTAAQAVEKGLVDGVMDEAAGGAMVASGSDIYEPTPEQLERARTAMSQKKPVDNSETVKALRNSINRRRRKGKYNEQA